MFKNLTGDGLGVSARQNEMVELALTYGFKGIDIDVTEMVSRIATFGEDFAKRYISSAQKSAKLKIGKGEGDPAACPGSYPSHRLTSLLPDVLPAPSPIVLSTGRGREGTPLAQQDVDAKARRSLNKTRRRRLGGRCPRSPSARRPPPSAPR